MIVVNQEINSIEANVVSQQAQKHQRYKKNENNKTRLLSF